MQIVPEERCDVVKKSLNPVTTCHVFSVQKGKLKVKFIESRNLSLLYSESNMYAMEMKLFTVISVLK